MKSCSFTKLSSRSLLEAWLPHTREIPVHELNSGLNVKPTNIQKISSEAFLLLNRASRLQGRNLSRAGGGHLAVTIRVGCLPANSNGPCSGQAQKRKSRDDGREADIWRLQTTLEKIKGSKRVTRRRVRSCPGPQTTAAHGRPHLRAETKKSPGLNKYV